MIVWVLFGLLITVLAHDDAISIQSRILYGHDARIEDYPFFAATDSCGAVILSDVWILTAAHCLANVETQKIVWVGGETYQNSIGVPYRQSIIHEKYTDVNGVPIDDIALIKLSTPLKFSSKIRPIKLPHSGSGSYRVLVVARGIDETGQVSPRLKKADLIRLTPEQCISQIPKVDLDAMGRENVKYLMKTNVCTKRENNRPTTCNGDSGSPLVSGDTIVGLVSYGLADCAQARLGFFVNVQYYLPWIRKHTGL